MAVCYSTHAMTEKEVKRTWRERLFSWPWRPGQKTKVVREPGIFRVGNMIVVHPALKESIEAAIRDGSLDAWKPKGV